MDIDQLAEIVEKFPGNIILLKGELVYSISSVLRECLSRKGVSDPVGRSVMDVSWLTVPDVVRKALEQPESLDSSITWFSEPDIPGVILAHNEFTCIDSLSPGYFLWKFCEKTGEWILDRIPEVVAVSSGFTPRSFSYISAGISEWTGVPAERFIKESELFIKMVHPEDRARLTQFLDAISEGHSHRSASFRLTNIDGSFRWIRFSAMPYQEMSGHCFYLFTMVDINDEMDSLLALKDASQRYRIFTEQSSVGVICFDRAGTVVESNERLAEILGVKLDRIVGKNLLGYSHPVLKGLVKRVLRGEVARHKGPYTSAISGRDLLLSIKIFPLRTEDGLILGGYGFVEDISHNVEMERRLEEEKRFNRAVVESAGLIVASVDRFGFIQKANSVLTDIAGVPGEDRVQGRLFWDVMVPESEQGRFIHGIKECIRDGLPFQIETHLRQEQDREQKRLISWRISPLSRQEKGFGSYLITGTDVTALKRLEDQFRASQKMEAIGRLAGGIAHDFNNQLTAILGYCQMMQMDMDSDDPYHRQLEIIITAAKRAAETTSQLLAFSRKQALQPKRVNINKIVRESAVLFERLIGEGIRIRYELMPSDAVVEIDPGQFQQVLLNLALNAKDAIQNSGTITIRTEVKSFVAVPGDDFGGSGTYVCVDVQDDGAGMSKDVLDRAFEPFFTTKPLGQGTGLGLSMVYGTIKQSGGHVCIDSAEGAGTTVHIMLPLVHGHVEEKNGEDSAEEDMMMHGTGRTVVVVEDEPMVLHLVRTFLKKMGFEARCFKEPSDALIYIESVGADQAIELLLTDLVLPGMSGKELAEKVLEFLPDLKVLYMSGYSAERISRHGILPGDSTFLQKPFTLSQFSMKVKSILEQ